MTNAMSLDSILRAPSTLARDLLLLAAVAAAVLLPGLGQSSNWANREARHAEIIREMAHSGDFVVPRLLGELYPDKPPAMHVPAALLTRWIGEPSMWIARLPSALAAIVGVLATYGLGRILYDRLAGMAAAVALLAMGGYVTMAHQVRPDMVLCAGILGTCLALTAGMREQARSRRGLYFALAGLAAGLGVLTKGPFGLAIPLLFAFLVVIRRSDLKLPRLGWLAFGLALAAVLLAWTVPAYLRDRGAYLMSVLTQPDLDASQTPFPKSIPYYLRAVVLSTLPVTLFVPWPLWDLRRRGYSAALSTAAAIAVIVCFMPNLRAHYLVPMQPFLALAIGDSVARRAATSPMLRRAFLCVIGAMLVGTPLFYTVFIRHVYAVEDPTITYAKQVRQAVGPQAELYSIRGYEETLALVWREHHRIHPIELRDATPMETIRRLPAGSYLVLPKKHEARFLGSAEEVPRQLVMEIPHPREDMVLYRLGAP